MLGSCGTNNSVISVCELFCSSVGLSTCSCRFASVQFFLGGISGWLPAQSTHHSKNIPRQEYTPTHLEWIDNNIKSSQIYPDILLYNSLKPDITFYSENLGK